MNIALPCLEEKGPIPYSVEISLEFQMPLFKSRVVLREPTFHKVPRQNKYLICLVLFFIVDGDQN